MNDWEKYKDSDEEHYLIDWSEDSDEEWDWDDCEYAEDDDY